MSDVALSYATMQTILIGAALALTLFFALIVVAAFRAADRWRRDRRRFARQIGPAVAEFQTEPGERPTTEVLRHPRAYNGEERPAGDELDLPTYDIGRSLDPWRHHALESVARHQL